MDREVGQGILLDWKAVGRDFLGEFPRAYPALDFLRGGAFDALQLQLANESSETCFEALSGFLRRHGYQLWSVDTGGDAYLLHAVAAGEAEAFVKACSHGAETHGCERLAPDAPAWKAPAKSGRKKPPTLVESTDWHCGYGGLYHGGGAVRHAIVPFENESGAFDLLVDLDVFPPQEIEADGFFALREQGHTFHPVHATSDGHYWEWEPARVRGRSPDAHGIKLIRITDYQTATFVEVERAARGAHGDGGRTGWGDTLCLERPADPSAAWFDAAAPVLDVLAPVGGGEDALVSVLCVQHGELRHVASLSCGAGMQLQLLAEDRLLVLRALPWTEAADGAMDLFLLDLASATVLLRCQLPHPACAMGASVHRLDAGRVLYVRREERPHPTHEHLKEKTGWLVELDVQGRRWREAALDGLHNDYTVNMAFRRGQAPDRHRVRSFDGHIVFATGHDPVVVLNYLTNVSGKHDAAWLWDRRDDRVTILRPADFEGGTPAVRYLPATQRYIADDSCRLDLLIPYAQIQATRPQTGLSWTHWQPLPTGDAVPASG
ncbi:MAG: hypothetical protein JNJ62_14700 [Pseudoxanthomonas mexicana]|nr:hypothetical protein [Pseudoxanthomonas mexicana]